MSAPVAEADHGSLWALLRRRWKLALPAAALVGVLAFLALAPVRLASREELFEIPPGTWDQRMHGRAREVLPAAMYLTLGLNDVLLLRNRDRVPQSFGTVLIMPGQEFRLPFEVASENQFDCTAHASGQMTVFVEPYPNPGWPRLAWRVRRALRRLAAW